MRTPAGMPEPKPKIEYMRPKQVEEAFGLSRITVRQWVGRRIKGARVGRTVLINVTDLRERLARVEQGEPWENVFSEFESSLGHYSGDQTKEA